jgi:ABC-type multidrug transport system fused ATPase/permease subunit
MEKDGKKSKITKSGIKGLLKLYAYMKPYRWKFFTGMLFLLISSSASLMFPKLLGNMVDAGNQGNNFSDITRIGIILAAVLVTQAVFSYFRTVLFVEVTEKTLASLRQSTYNHIIKLPMHFFSRRRVGELNSRISADIALLQDSLISVLSDFIYQIIIISGGIILLMHTSMKLTVFMLVILPPVVLFAFFFGRFIRRYSKIAQNQVADSNIIVEETLQGIQNVKAFANEQFEMKRYTDKTNEVAHTGIKGGRYRAYFSFIILFFFGAMALVIWKGATLIATKQLAPGELLSFVIYSGFIAGNIAHMAGVFTSLQKTLGATENLLELFNEKAEEISLPVKIATNEVLQGKIEFRDLSFEYPSRKEYSVLQDVNVTIQPGQQVAIVGPSGAGKSTLVSLLFRFYEPSKGIILFDGKDSKDFSISALRSQLAMVPQDVFLFGGTIRENIVYGNPSASDSEIIEAAKQANAWEYISAFPEKLDTIVGERGVQLSGGQRQRIAIARAVLRNPKILILDEATSSLDSESERLVQDALEKLMKGRTSLVIAHRLSTIRQADKIIVLDKGRVVEEGSHNELVMLPEGLYKSLSELQFAV